MMNSYYAALLLTAATVANGYNQSMEDCQAFASQFQASCESVTEPETGDYKTWKSDDIMCR